MGTERCSGIIICPPVLRGSAADSLPDDVPGPDFIIRMVMDQTAPLVEDLVLVADDPSAFTAFDALIVRPSRSDFDLPTALLAGLHNCDHDRALVVSWQQPLVRAGVLALLMEASAPRYDMVLAALGTGYRFFPGVYATRCRDRLEHMIDRRPAQLDKLLKKTCLRAVSEKRLRQKDPRLISFLNLQIPDDRRMIRQWLGGQTGT